MKTKLCLLLAAALLSTTLSFAQWSVSGNKIYYTQGNTGVGTSSPHYTLDINGDLNLSASSELRIGGVSSLKEYATKNNVSVGYHAYDSIKNGYKNTAIGYEALFLDSSGFNNTAAGASALYSNRGGSYNTALGTSTLYSNTSGSYNTAICYESLYFNTTGNNNTATGYETLNKNTTGNNNTANGFAALYANMMGSNNTANGYEAMFKNSSGLNNTATGYEAMYSNTSGYYNTANGYAALYSNVSGYYSTADGYQALYSNTTGTQNAALGYEALYSNVSGGFNTASGYQALYNCTTGNYNTASGYMALSNCKAGQNISAFGYNATVVGDSLTDVTVIGSNAVSSASNQVRIGDNAVTSIGGYANWTNISADARIKKNIKQNVPGLAFINQLIPVTFNVDLNAADRIVQPTAVNNNSGSIPAPSQQAARTAKEQVVYTGFNAQDVQKAAQSINYNFSGVDPAKNSKDLYGLRYDEFVVPLVKAVQELSVQNDSLKSANTQQLQQINALSAEIAKIEAAMSKCCSSFSSNMQAAENNQQAPAITDVPQLSQNIPNPFSSSSYISYYIPSGFHNAQLMITDISGNVLKNFTLQSSGYGKQTISNTEMAPGMYQYSLLIDGKLVDTKKMILAK